MRKYATAILGILFCFANNVGIAQDGAGTPSTFEQQLQKEDSAALARAAREQGDVTRGAIAFFQPHLACIKCHDPGGEASPLGPELTKPDKDVTDPHFVESLLSPSKAIKKGYESVVVITDRGRTLTGLLAEDRTDELVLRDPAQDGKIITIPAEKIDERFHGKVSAMPTGLVNGLAGRQQFLDLVRYLLEIADKGQDRARQLRAVASLYAARPLPEYEKIIDHAGMIADLGGESLKRGEAIYDRLCVNCHGTKDEPGSLPTSLKFASDKFKNGSDPHSMYQTLTNGYGMMVAQSWMVPKQKYDVIHYVREKYLKPYNTTQYGAIDDTYLAALPEGTTRGPEPSSAEPWVSMDYGPNLIASYEVGNDASNFAYKGIAVRLDAGPGGVSQGQYWMLYDHDTMRVAAAWSGSGFIDWNAIMLNGKHAIHPRIVGEVHFANPTAPGWGNPEDGGFEDPRLRGRDDRPYGPLPRDWAHYKGLYHFGNQVIVAYTVGETDVLEMPSLHITGTGPVFARNLNIGPRDRDLALQVARHPRGETLAATAFHSDMVVLGQVESLQVQSDVAPLHFDGATNVEVTAADDFDFTHSDYSICARIKTRQGGSIFCKTAPSGPWVADGKTLFVRGGKLTFDIGWVGAVQSRRSVNDDRWHDIVMTWQNENGDVRLYVDGKLEGEGRLKPSADVNGHVVRVGFTSSNFPRSQSHFDGQISDVRFFRRTLDDKEVASIGSDAASDKDLVAHWKLDVVRDDTVRDVTGNNHDGRVIKGAGDARREGAIVAGLSPAIPDATWSTNDEGDLRLTIPAGAAPLNFVLWTASPADGDEVKSVVSAMTDTLSPIDLRPLTEGGPPRWPDKLTTQGIRGSDDGPFAVDTLTHPARNPWSCRTRFTGFDFFPDGRQAAVCTWDGSVWLVSGIAPELEAPAGTGSAESGSDATDAAEPGLFELTWQRIASGLFQPLGLKIVDGRIYVTCRDQIVILNDQNGDGEIDFYENFNSDHQVTEHFHEFAMGLQTDAEGNFYYSKGARHAKTALVPQHGTLLRVSKDGSSTEILARGFRAPNGVCVNPDGTCFITDQEGHWMPKNRINWIRGEGRYYGNFWGYHDVTDPSDDAMEPPLCWITNAVDRSPAELMWVDSKAWGPLDGTLLNTSYGYGKIYVVPHEKAGARLQGGVCELPIPLFPTGVMRGRFHPDNGQLYACGMFAWAGNQHQPGGFYRVRYTGKPVHLPIGLNARQDGITVTFSGTLDRKSATDVSNYGVKTWTLHRSANYGSDHINEKPSKITDATLSDDGRSVFLKIPDIKPTWCMEIKYSIKGAGGEFVDGKIHNTIHQLGE
ncbi:MAG: c-type cytochrome [Planctomycetes bacterium]|nr:c-type cytochrome [Planctomycetota bacterium]MBL7039197.1 c-type cytochrome [Pirellulaceae bacterium]